MAEWQLTLGLQNLRSQVNARWPNRDKASDGSIGDTAHQASTSGHNRDDTSGSRPAWNGDADSTAEVRAWDCDNDFRETGTSGQDVIDHIRRLPGLAGVLRYMIYNRRMYHARDGFAPTPYDGPSPHTEHIHFEGAWSQAADNNTSFDYRLDDVNMPTAAEIVDELLARNLGASGPTVGRALQAGAYTKAELVDALLARGLGSSGVPTVGVALQSGAYRNSNDLLAKVGELNADVAQVASDVTALTGAVATLSAAVAAVLPPAPEG